MVQMKMLEVTCSTGTRACEYRVEGYCIGSAIYGPDSFSLLVPSHIDYSKVDPGLSDRAYFLQNQGIIYIKSYFIIDSGSFKCYMRTLVTNLQLFYTRMGVTRIAG